MLEVRVPQLCERCLAKGLGAASVVGRKFRFACGASERGDGLCICKLVGVDRGAKCEAAGEAVLVIAFGWGVCEAGTGSIDGRNCVLGGVEQRFDPVEVSSGVEVVVPEVVDVLHRVEMAERGRGIACDFCPRIGCGGDGFGEVPVIPPACVEMVDEGRDVCRIAQPAAFHNVKRGRVVEVGVRMARPGNVVEELGFVRALRTYLANMGTI